MENEKKTLELFKEGFRKEIKQTLKNWQDYPESPEMFEKMRTEIKDAFNLKLDLIFQIHDSIFENSERRRGVNRDEIKKYAKRHGDFWVFYLKPHKSIDSTQGVSVVDLLEGSSIYKDRGIIDKYNFVMRLGPGGARHELMILRPNEIAGINVR